MTRSTEHTKEFVFEGIKLKVKYTIYSYDEMEIDEIIIMENDGDIYDWWQSWKTEAAHAAAEQLIYQGGDQ